MDKKCTKSSYGATKERRRRVTIAIPFVAIVLLNSGCGFKHSSATTLSVSQRRDFHDSNNYIAPPAPPSTPSVEEAKVQVRTSPHSAKAYYLLGLAYYKQKDYSQAISNLDHARYLAPRQPAVYWWLADAYSASGQSVRALPILLQLVKLPEHNRQTRSDTFTMLGNCYWDLHRLTEASESWRESLRYDPHQPASLLGLGLWAAHERQLIKARLYFEEAIRYGQTPYLLSRAHASLGKLAEDCSDWKNAQGEYRLALQNDDTNVSAIAGSKRVEGK